MNLYEEIENLQSFKDDEIIPLIEELEIEDNFDVIMDRCMNQMKDASIQEYGETLYYKVIDFADGLNFVKGELEELQLQCDDMTN